MKKLISDNLPTPAERLNMFIQKHFLVLSFFVLALAFFNLFYNLGGGRVIDWDEARHGISAYEMVKNNEYIISTYSGAADDWNVKPPLGLWAIAVSYKIFGFNTFALRAPSALFAFFTVALVMLFCKKYLGGAQALLAGIILSVNPVFIAGHSGRMGEFDAALAFFIFSAVFLLRLFESEEKPGYFYLSALALSMAFLVKSFAALQGFAVFFVYIFGTQFYKTINLKKFIVFSFLFCAPVLIWMCARCAADGIWFLKHMFVFDLFSRSTSALEGNSQPFYFYLGIILKACKYWLAFLFVVVLMFLPFKKKDIQAFFDNKNIRLAALACVVIIVLFSIVKTKLYWYINPAYPFLSILIAGGICFVLGGERAPARKNLFYGALILLALSAGLCQAELTRKIKDQKVLKYKHHLILKYAAPKDKIFLLPGIKLRQSEKFLLDVVLDCQAITVNSYEQFVRQASKDNYLILEDYTLSDYENLKYLYVYDNVDGTLVLKLKNI